MKALPCEPTLLETPLKTYRLFQTTPAITKSLRTSTQTKFSFQNHSFHNVAANVHRSGPSPHIPQMADRLPEASRDYQLPLLTLLSNSLPLPLPTIYPCIFA